MWLKPKPRPLLLAPWEKATHVAPNSVLPVPGLLSVFWAAPLTFIGAALIALALGPAWGLGATLLGLTFARLIALDLTTYQLPNVYTLPLLAVGLVHALHTPVWPWALGLAAGAVVLALLGNWLAQQRGWNRGFGMGDAKLLAALLLWLPLPVVPSVLAVGCLVWLPVACWRPRAPVPFGVPLVLGWLAWLMAPQLLENLPTLLLGLAK